MDQDAVSDSIECDQRVWAVRTTLMGTLMFLKALTYGSENAINVCPAVMATYCLPSNS